MTRCSPESHQLSTNSRGNDSKDIVDYCRCKWFLSKLYNVQRVVASRLLYIVGSTGTHSGKQLGYCCRAL